MIHLQIVSVISVTTRRQVSKTIFEIPQPLRHLSLSLYPNLVTIRLLGVSVTLVALGTLYEWTHSHVIRLFMNNLFCLTQYRLVYPYCGHMTVFFSLKY